MLVIIQAPDDEIARVKKELRLGLENPNYLIHSSDSWAETFAIASSLMHPESLKALNNRPLRDLSPLDTLSQRFFRSGDAEDDGLTSIVLGGSASMLAHGIRHCRDVDIIFGNASKRILDDPKVSVRKAYESEGDSVEIELDPRKYLYFRGIKISSLTATRMFKVARGDEPKDSNDVLEINRYLRGTHRVALVELNTNYSKVFALLTSIFFILSQRLSHVYNFALRIAIWFYRLLEKTHKNG
jgi:hypothetical protein